MRISFSPLISLCFFLVLADLVWSFPPIFFFCDTVFLLLVSSLLSTLKGLFYSPCSAAQHTVLLPTASNACIARSVGSCTCGMTAAGVGDGEGRNTESDEWLLREAVKGQPRTLFFSIAVYRSLSLTFTWSALSALSPMCRGLTYFLLSSPLATLVLWRNFFLLRHYLAILRVTFIFCGGVCRRDSKAGARAAKK